ncbi:MAG: 2-oxoacid:acceptor oxidoreductase family protein [Desulfobacterales bacterium]|nr:MAG: 2-oxoacid:acceptor oxidoreductase family protein [Desulfobacterales bacterium]
MDTFNIFMIGTGGQGIGLLSEVLLRATDHAGLTVKGVDTHGLAQRGGIVISQLRIGANVYSPLIPRNEADLTIALERHEALRGMHMALKDGGTLIYYNTAWQPLDVRLKLSEPVSEDTIHQQCRNRNIKLIKVYKKDLKDARMQNTVVLAKICRYELIPVVKKEHYLQAMDDLMQGTLLETNVNLFTEEIL